MAAVPPTGARGPPPPLHPIRQNSLTFSGQRFKRRTSCGVRRGPWWRSGGAAGSCCVYEHSNGSARRSAAGWGGQVGWSGWGMGGWGFKGLSPVSNSSQRDRTTLSSLFNLRLKRATFVSLVFHCSCVCGSSTSGPASKYGSRFR